MAYDRQLAERIRSLVAGEAELAEKQMFGGLAFLVAGNMAVAVSGRGSLMVRSDPADTGRWLMLPGAGPMEMNGRVMRGWILVDDQALETEDELAAWVRRGFDCARTLPAK